MLLAVSRWKGAGVGPGDALPKISVIIPAINEAGTIRKTLDGFATQTFKDYELIVVDGGSRDGTAGIAKRYAKVIIERRKGLGLGRNVGAKAAKGRILVFMDADTVPSRNLLERVDQMLGNGNTGISAAAWRIDPIERANLRIRLGYYLVSGFFVKLSILIGRPKLMGTGFAVTKDAFNRCGRFDESLPTYEDWEFSRRIKKYGKIAFIEDTYAMTSARRVMKWGVGGYFFYHVGNMIKYDLFGKVHGEYEQIR